MLSINGIDFLSMPYTAEIEPTGPQNIECGEIKLNDEVVHSQFLQYTANAFNDLIDEKELQPTTDMFIGYLSCSSAEVVNSVIDCLGRSIDEE